MIESTRERWNREYKAGRWDFLDADTERARMSVVAGLLRAPRNHAIVDLGCGPGLLLDLMPVLRRSDYVAVDISDAALARVRDRCPQARVQRASLAEFQPDDAPVGSLVASEVLTYDDDSVAHLARIAHACPDLSQVIVSVVAGHPDKPNWARGAERVWSALAALAWQRVRSATMTDEETGVRWELVDFRPLQAHTDRRDSTSPS